MNSEVTTPFGLTEKAVRKRIERGQFETAIP
jgi:hypothetical protein